MRLRNRQRKRNNRKSEKPDSLKKTEENRDLLLRKASLNQEKWVWIHLLFNIQNSLIKKNKLILLLPRMTVRSSSVTLWRTWMTMTFTFRKMKSHTMKTFRLIPMKRWTDKYQTISPM